MNNNVPTPMASGLIMNTNLKYFHHQQDLNFVLILS